MFISCYQDNRRGSRLSDSRDVYRCGKTVSVYFHWSVDIDERSVFLFISHHSVFFQCNNKWVSRPFYWFITFWLSSSEGDRKGNCHPGLVVKNEVTGPMRNDFYLQSHAAIQGSKLYVFCLANMLTVFFSSSSFCPLHSPSRWYFQR